MSRGDSSLRLITVQPGDFRVFKSHAFYICPVWTHCTRRRTAYYEARLASHMITFFSFGRTHGRSPHLLILGDSHELWILIVGIMAGCRSFLTWWVYSLLFHEILFTTQFTWSFLRLHGLGLELIYLVYIKYDHIIDVYFLYLPLFSGAAVQCVFYTRAVSCELNWSNKFYYNGRRAILNHNVYRAVSAFVLARWCITQWLTYLCMNNQNKNQRLLAQTS